MTELYQQLPVRFRAMKPVRRSTLRKQFLDPDPRWNIFETVLQKRLEGGAVFLDPVEEIVTEKIFRLLRGCIAPGKRHSITIISVFTRNIARFLS